MVIEIYARRRLFTLQILLSLVGLGLGLVAWSLFGTLGAFLALSAAVWAAQVAVYRPVHAFMTAFKVDGLPRGGRYRAIWNEYSGQVQDPAGHFHLLPYLEITDIRRRGGFALITLGSRWIAVPIKLLPGGTTEWLSGHANLGS
jgi:hypothetical protein